MRISIYTLHFLAVALISLSLSLCCWQTGQQKGTFFYAFKKEKDVGFVAIAICAMVSSLCGRNVWHDHNFLKQIATKSQYLPIYRCSWFVLLLLFSFILGLVNGTGYWTNRNTTITNVDFVSATWSSSMTCYMVGYNAEFGSIIKSTNAGITWKSVLQGTDTTSRFSDIATVNGTSYLFAVSLSGNVYVSNDGYGNVFNPIGSALPANLYGSGVGSNGNGFAVGLASTIPFNSVIYKSTLASGYTVWNDYSPPSTAPVLLTAVSTFNGNNVIAVGFGGLVYSSTTGGVSGWTTTYWPPCVNNHCNLQCVSFGTSTSAMAAGDHKTLIITNDGGLNWADLTYGFDPDVQAQVKAATDFAFHAIMMVNAQVNNPPSSFSLKRLSDLTNLTLT